MPVRREVFGRGRKGRGMGLLGWTGVILLGLAALYLFLIAPNVRHRKIVDSRLLSRDYAHRGLHEMTMSIPENSMAAFRRAVEQGYGIELDVHATLDGKLVVHHDDSLQRICGADQKISQSTAEMLSAFCLGGTNEKIPTLDEVLQLVNGQVPLIIEMKSDHPGNTGLSPLLWQRMRNYPGPWCVESFDPLLLRWFKKHAPDVVRGQLAWDARKAGKNYLHVLEFFLAHLLLNAFSRPDFVAYGYESDQNFSFRVIRNLFRPMLVAWTVRSKKDYEELQFRYDLQIFESFQPQR